MTQNTLSRKTTVRNRLRPLGRELLFLAALGTAGATGEALAQPGFANNVKDWCSTAGRPAPVFAADECSTCHSGSNYGASTPQKTAYRSKNLDVFCPAPAVPANAAPNLILSPSGAQTVAVGQTLQITASASDPDQDPVLLSAESLPSGASFDNATGVFSWTPGAGSKGIYNVILKATDQPSDASQAQTVQQTVTITVTEAGTANAAPQMDSIPTPQSATALETLTFRVTALDADDDELALSASNLPTGAKFTDLGLVDGKWTGEFRWQPSQQQVGQSVTATFVAREVGTSPTQQDAQDVEFQVAAASSDASIRKVVVERAKYRNGTLKVQGKVKLQNRNDSASTLVVHITDVAGNLLGQTTPSRRGRWTFTLALAANALPCRVQATVNGVSSTSRPVKPAVSSCGSVPVFTDTDHDGLDDNIDTDDDGDGISDVDEANNGGDDNGNGGDDNGNGGDDNGNGGDDNGNGGDDNGNGGDDNGNGGDHDGNGGNDGDHDGNGGDHDGNDGDHDGNDD